MDDLAAPPLHVSRWFNGDASLSLEILLGRPVFLHAFQMLCPGCVQHAVPQSQKVAEAFARSDLAVVGLHTVFEHHAVMGPEALEVYLHENRIRYPVGVDAYRDGDPARHPLPLTMAAYAMRGTPTLILIDRKGRLRVQHFGGVDDLRLGAEIATLLAEPA
ncbi:MAG: TlpA family protein disulfide reductase [Lysobacteraceae bacterium]|nr:MAG: TlpA family protein disulfide reductase [Xanthomonadaceae bacterium]